MTDWYGMDTHPQPTFSHVEVPDHFSWNDNLGIVLTNAHKLLPLLFPTTLHLQV